MTDKIASEMQRTNIKLLWGAANIFSHDRYTSGAATNPNPDVFAYAVAKVKQAIDITHQLHGANYLLWGGHEGYDVLLNTRLNHEYDQLARFLIMLVEYKYKIGFKGALLIQPKPCDQARHPYDFDAATLFAFLQKYGIEKEFKVNIETTLGSETGHSHAHEVVYLYTNHLFGSIDTSQMHLQSSPDSNLEAKQLNNIVQVIYIMLRNNGFSTGGFNFDTQANSQSLDLVDLYYGYIHSVDTLARGLLIANDLIAAGEIEKYIDHRYAQWQSSLGKDILQGKSDFETIAQYALDKDLNPGPLFSEEDPLEKIIGGV